MPWHFTDMPRVEYLQYSRAFLYFYSSYHAILHNVFTALRCLILLMTIRLTKLPHRLYRFPSRPPPTALLQCLRHPAIPNNTQCPYLFTVILAGWLISAQTAPFFCYFLIKGFDSGIMASLITICTELIDYLERYQKSLLAIAYI